MTTIPPSGPPPDRPDRPDRSAGPPSPSAAAPARPVLLLTRPRDGAETFLAALGALGGWDGEVVVSPVLEIAPVSAGPLDPGARALIFTSTNAVRFYEGPTTLPAFCVGAATTAEAGARGFAVREVGADAATLIARLPDHDPPTPLVHVRGAHVARPVAEALSEAGLRCREWIVYDQVARALDGAARAALDGAVPVVLPVFSPRSAAILCNALHDAPPSAPCHFVAISAAVAGQIRQILPDARVATALTPDAAAMAKLVHASASGVHVLEGRSPLP